MLAVLSLCLPLSLSLSPPPLFFFALSLSLPIPLSLVQRLACGGAVHWLIPESAIHAALAFCNFQGPLHPRIDAAMQRDAFHSTAREAFA